VSGAREFLAVLSALCGLTLLTFGAWGVLQPKTASRRQAWALGLYGLLFLFSGVVLWTRGETRATPRPTPRPPDVAATTPSQPSDSATTPVRSGWPEVSQAFDSGESDGRVNFHPLPEPRVTARMRGAAGLIREEYGLGRAGKRSRAQSGRAEVGSPEDQLSEAVLRAFDAIEEWFFRHGSPVPSAAGKRVSLAGREGRFELPAIMFLDDTAELTVEGAHRLKLLAGRLRSRPDSGMIEIHARTGDSDPTPFHFILTQARAEVVRDFLMNEGVRNYRLVAKAMSSESEDSTIARPQVRLVFRP
jgi:outer membrane protein OmpA-like peptidoglycan-associated protein